MESFKNKIAVVTGGGGDDTLTGGSGADVYVVGPDDGTDTITDFAVGEDQIDIRALGIDTYGELYENMYENENGDLVIDFAEGTSMVLEGVSKDDITADDLTDRLGQLENVEEIVLIASKNDVDY